MSYPASSGRTPVIDRFWAEGCDTLSFPTDIKPGFYYWAENVVNRGGIVQTRPGRKLLATLPGKNAQGLGFYRPYREKEQLTWAIDGQCFYWEFPFAFDVDRAPTRIGGYNASDAKYVQFDPRSPKVFFCQGRKEVDLNPDGSLTLLDHPVDILFIQDGYTASAYYEATNATKLGQSGHNKAIAPFLQCPTGTSMAFSGSRLWVADQETIYASDLLNPNSFSERTYLAEADGFKLPEPCTGLLETPLLDALMCFTPFTITSIQSAIIDRTLWQQTPKFQDIVSKDYGSVSPFGITNQFGLPWFFSEVGLLSFNEALNQYRSSRVNSQDNEMTRSKSNMSPIRSGIAIVAFENWLLVAVPSGSRYNRHSWVMDGAPMSLLGSQAGPCWSGIWTGTYPVQFVTGEVQDAPRCFELSYSCSTAPISPGFPQAGQPGRIQLWENFIGRRTDHENTPISCSWETKIFEVSQIGELCRFKYAEVDLVEVLDEVILQIYYAGIKGHYRQILNTVLKAEEGLPGNDPNYVFSYGELPTDTIAESFKPQTRTVRTEEMSGSAEEQDACADTCGIESVYEHNVDRGFQLLFNWQGRMGIREVRLFIEPYPQKGIGECAQSELGKIPPNIVSAIGCLPPPVACYWSKPIAYTNLVGPFTMPAVHATSVAQVTAGTASRFKAGATVLMQHLGYFSVSAVDATADQLTLQNLFSNQPFVSTNPNNGASPNLAPGSVAASGSQLSIRPLAAIGPGQPYPPTLDATGYQPL
jgi:hypothetical protein